MTSVKNNRRKKNPKKSQGVVGARKVKLSALEKVLLGGGALVNIKPKERK
jgi:hypothetical protein